MMFCLNHGAKHAAMPHDKLSLLGFSDRAMGHLSFFNHWLLRCSFFLKFYHFLCFLCHFQNLVGMAAKPIKKLA